MTASYPPLRDLRRARVGRARATRCATRATGGCRGCPEPCALVVFGVTGDLARKKLIPAVYDLANRGLLPPGFALLGFARRDWGDGDFAQLAREAAEKGARTGFREDVWQRLAGQHPVRARLVRRRRRLRHAGRRR